MSEKKYAIIRVDKRCPQEFEKIDIEYICRNDKCFQWEGCRRRSRKFFGDTKEQLIRKVAQILFKNAPKETYQPRYIEQKRKILEVAKEIVEFLGVE